MKVMNATLNWHFRGWTLKLSFMNHDALLKLSSLFTNPIWLPLIIIASWIMMQHWNCLQCSLIQNVCHYYVMNHDAMLKLSSLFTNPIWLPLIIIASWIMMQHWNLSSMFTNPKWLSLIIIGIMMQHWNCLQCFLNVSWSKMVAIITSWIIMQCLNCLQCSPIQYGCHYCIMNHDAMLKLPSMFTNPKWLSLLHHESWCNVEIVFNVHHSPKWLSLLHHESYDATLKLSSIFTYPKWLPLLHHESWCNVAIAFNVHHSNMATIIASWIMMQLWNCLQCSLIQNGCHYCIMNHDATLKLSSMFTDPKWLSLLHHESWCNVEIVFNVHYWSKMAVIIASWIMMQRWNCLQCSLIQNGCHYCIMNHDATLKLSSCSLIQNGFHYCIVNHDATLKLSSMFIIQNGCHCCICNNGSHFGLVKIEDNFNSHHWNAHVWDLTL